MYNNDIFEDLFVLEAASNHWGSVERGLKLVNEYAKIIRFNSVRAAIKFQFRDFKKIIHKDYRHRTDIRYIKKMLSTQMTDEDYEQLIEGIKKSGCIPLTTPFDERSVYLCEKFDLPIIKIASAEINDWILLERIAKTKKPVIASTGGSSLKDMDDLIKFFENRNIPIAINHCVSIYPSLHMEIELNQVDFLKKRYPGHVIGLSTHEYNMTRDDMRDSMLISYGKGVRTWERHVDIDMDGIPVAPYCALPHQIDEWFKAYHKAREMCGAPGTAKRIVPLKETVYLDETIRGVYAKTDLPKGHKITEEDLYLAIPLLKGQISTKELMAGEILIKSINKDKPIFIDMIDSAYAYNETLKAHIYNRGIDINSPIKEEKIEKKIKKIKNKEKKDNKDIIKKAPDAFKNYLKFTNS